MSSRARSTLFFLGFILLIAIISGVVALVKGIGRSLTPVTAVTFSDIADHDGDKIAIEGVIEFGSEVKCNDSGTVCNFYLEPADGSDTPDLEVILWIAEADYGEQQPNHFSLPFYYEKDDFRIYTDSGQELTRHDPVRITGVIDHINFTDDTTDVYVDVIKVEAAGQ